MDLWLPGVMHPVVVTVRQFEISSGVYSRFKPHMGPLLLFLKMDPSLHGVVQTLAVTVQQFEISSRVFSPVMCVCQVLGRKMPVCRVCRESRGEQMLVQPQLGHIELVQVCSAVVLFLTHLLWTCGMDEKIVFHNFGPHNIFRLLKIQIISWNTANVKSHQVA